MGFVFPLFAQENVRDVGSENRFDKTLTVNQTDQWNIELTKAETIRVRVFSNQFDPVLVFQTDKEEILREADDEGNESFFMIRLTEPGTYHILVHAFMKQGGGRYTLYLDRFESFPLNPNESTVQNFNREGKYCHYFSASKDSYYIPQFSKLGISNWEVFDPKGKRIENIWQDMIPIKITGEHVLMTYGNNTTRFQVTLKPVEIRRLEINEDYAEELEKDCGIIWIVETQPAQFLSITLWRSLFLAYRVIPAPFDENETQGFDPANSAKQVSVFPLSNKGEQWTYAFQTNQVETYYLQLRATNEVTYRVCLTDPTIPLSLNSEYEGSLALGASSFYTFNVDANEVIRFRVSSTDFDPILRIYKPDGSLFMENDDTGFQTNASIQTMIREAGAYRIQVNAAGWGGGGSFQVELWKEEIPTIDLDKSHTCTLTPGTTNYYRFLGEEGEMIIINAHAEAIDPEILVYSPDGVVIGGDDDQGVGLDSLLAIQFDRSGPYLLSIWSNGGEGICTLMLFRTE